MTNRELLELAAKSAGVELVRSRLDDEIHRDMLIKSSVRSCTQALGPWNPLTDDGDALRLASKLGMNLDMTPGKFVEASVFVEANTRRLSGVCECGPAPDYYAATRRAIVLAAAEIGRAMP